MFTDLEKKEDISLLLDTLFGNKNADQPRSSCQSCTKSGVIKRIDYKNSKKKKIKNWAKLYQFFLYYSLTYTKSQLGFVGYMDID